MESIKTQADIAAPVERVFAYLEDPRNDTEWLPSLLEVRNITGSGEGQRHEWTYRMAGLKLDGESTIVEHVPHERLVMKTKGGAESTWTVQLTPSSLGTRLDLTVDYTVPLPVLGKIAEKVIVRRNAREIEMAAQNIKDQCEAKPVARAAPSTKESPVTHASR